MAEEQRIDLRRVNLGVAQGFPGHLDDQVFQRRAFQATKTGVTSGNNGDAISRHNQFLLFLIRTLLTMTHP